MKRHQKLRRFNLFLEEGLRDAAKQEGQEHTTGNDGEIRSEEREVSILREREQGNDKGSDEMRRNPENSKVKGVDVRHPSIVRAVRNATARGFDTDRISKITGMPYTVVQDIKREVGKVKEADKGYPG